MVSVRKAETETMRIRSETSSLPSLPPSLPPYPSKVILLRLDDDRAANHRMCAHDANVLVLGKGGREGGREGRRTGR